MDDELVGGHLQELRRGTVVLACLATLERPRYGYALLETLDAAGFAVDGNTLYPLLRRLEKQGLLTSEWDTGEARPRKFYRTSPAGAQVRARLMTEWRSLDSAVAALDGDQS
ncbi:MAG: PadR family transcriptional regulator [Janibacter sp.]